MPCYSPLVGYFGKDVHPVTGGRRLVFDKMKSFSGIPVQVPCGQCIGCRLERSRQWALRIVHEKRMHRDSAFLTLTYDDKNLPEGNSLSVRDLQLFMKRLRFKYGKYIRFYACGEYGETTRRPHYHVLLLNMTFPDLKQWKVTRSGSTLYVSKSLGELWNVGHSYVGDVTFSSAAYVARYCTKKIVGAAADAHYAGRAPEFSTMSRRPGIGMEWIEKYGDEAYAHDSAIADGKEVPLTRFYDTKMSAREPEAPKGLIDKRLMSRVKRSRRRKALANKADNTPERLRVRERLAELTLARFARDET